MNVLKAIRLRGGKAVVFIRVRDFGYMGYQGALLVLFFRKSPELAGLFLSAENMIKFRQVTLQHIGQRARVFGCINHGCTSAFPDHTDICAVIRTRLSP